MPLVKSGQCEQDVSTDVVACPHCGAPRLTPASVSPPSPTSTAAFFRKPSPVPSSDAGHGGKPVTVATSRQHDQQTPTRAGTTFTSMHVVVALLLVVAVGMLWYGLHRRAAEPLPASTTAAPASRAFGAAQRQAVTEVLTALRSLQSVTTAGITYPNYAPRVIDTKVAIDAYPAAHSGDDERLVRAIERTMTLYVLASGAWNTSIVATGDSWPDGARFINQHRAEVSALCPLADSTWQEGRDKGFYAAALADSVPELFSCASDSLADATEALKGRL